MTERVLTLSEIATLLHMKRPNVGKYLRRHGVEPLFEKAQGYLYSEAEILRLKQQREADEAKLEADAKRRASARARRVNGSRPSARNLGETQREVLQRLDLRPSLKEAHHLAAARRLESRGLVRGVPGEPRCYTLTEEGELVLEGLG